MKARFLRKTKIYGGDGNNCGNLDLNWKERTESVVTFVWWWFLAGPSVFSITQKPLDWQTDVFPYKL